jgi:hypothetical protein
MQHMPAAIGPQSEVVILPSRSPDEVQSAMRRMFNLPSQEPGVAACEPAENRETPSAEELNQLLGQVRIEYRDDMNSIFLGNPQQNSRWEGLQDQLDSLDELVLLQTTLALGFTTGLLAHFLHRRDQRTKRANESTPQA